MEEENKQETEAQETQEPQEKQEAEKLCEDLLKEAEDKYLRAYAEFENIKKRLEREKYQAIDYALEQFAKDLLPAIDALGMALKIEEKEQFDKLKEGVELTKASLLKSYEKHGITPVSHDDGFDPNFHEAVMQIASEEHEDNQIVAVMQQGYAYKGRVLRPSLVSVCKK